MKSFLQFKQLFFHNFSLQDPVKSLLNFSIKFKQTVTLVKTAKIAKVTQAAVKVKLAKVTVQAVKRANLAKVAKVAARAANKVKIVKMAKVAVLSLLFFQSFPSATFATDFSYTGGVQTFTVPTTGTYKLEVWGAQGGTAGSYRGGYGSYSKGEVYLTAGQTLYIYVGGTPSSYSSGGYNGGGTGAGETATGYYGSAGGGATHIATTTGLLSTLSSKIGNILIVAGGGGGGGQGDYYGVGGDAGGVQGKSISAWRVSAGGTQSSGNAFGQGGNGYSSGWGGGGGGGYYGGVGGVYGPAGGGSGYIGNSSLAKKAMYCYSCTSSGGTSSLTYSTTNVSATATSDYAKSGAGFARINYVSAASPAIPVSIDYDYIGKYETFTAPTASTYKLEVWGAQGSAASSYRGGYGGYSKGEVSLTAGQVLYIYVGSSGGYNGGGTGAGETATGYYGSAGGGATHIATTTGLLSTLSSKIGNILIVAGGGGGGGQGDCSGVGGNGGGIQGITAKDADWRVAAGGTQSSGNAFGQGGNGYSSGWGGGGGGGYYGGVGGVYGPAGGGSGYIGNSSLTNKFMYCYDCTTSSVTTTLTYSTTNVSGAATANYAKGGNGFAKIALIDLIPPDGGSITYANTAITKADQTLSLTVNDGTDATSGINTSSRLLQRSAAPIIDGTCDTYSNFSTVTYSGTYPNITTTNFEIDHCYKYRWLVSDVASNQAVYTSNNYVYTSPRTFSISSLAVGTIIQTNEVKFIKANSNNLLLALKAFSQSIFP